MAIIMNRGENKMDRKTNKILEKLFKDEYKSKINKASNEINYFKRLGESATKENFVTEWIQENE